MKTHLSRLKLIEYLNTRIPIGVKQHSASHMQTFAKMFSNTCLRMKNNQEKYHKKLDNPTARIVYCNVDKNQQLLILNVITYGKKCN